MPEATTSYSSTRQALHWTSALLILAMFPLGYVMVCTGSDSVRTALYASHALIGLTILVLSIVRIVLARRNKVAPPEGLAPWNRRLRAAIQALALLVPLLLAASGVATLASNGLIPGVFQPGVTIPATLEDASTRTGHRHLAWTYLALLGVHVLGVMRYQFTKGDVLGRMGVRRPPA